MRDSAVCVNEMRAMMKCNPSKQLKPLLAHQGGGVYVCVCVFVSMCACVQGAMCSPIISWNNFLEIEIQIGRKVFVPIFHLQGHRGGVGRRHICVCVKV